MDHTNKQKHKALTVGDSDFLTSNLSQPTKRGGRQEIQNSSGGGVSSWERE
jgi:hypothetical protein